MTSHIITLGLAPAWDLTCQGDHLRWNTHPKLNAQHLIPAGKALNISRILNWMGQPSTGAGWWGRDDLKLMQCHLEKACRKVQVKMTPVPGRTRINVTILDQARSKELHLRAANSFASPSTFQSLQNNLEHMLQPNTTCVLAGALPDRKHKNQLVALAKTCLKQPDTRLIVDASGPLYRELVQAGLPWLITPNIEEFRELLGTDCTNRIPSLIKAARTLTHKVPNILISRGKRGALLVTKDQAWHAHCDMNNPIVSTVGCGDALLAGFLYGLQKHDHLDQSLIIAIQSATAHARGWTSTRTWQAVKKHISVSRRNFS